ncbi:MAG TPA: putative quinol monooxygenase [Syntrophales bacterium]|nr:putative quinol monooxygenase [Syntrophales bacterium]HPO35698.1 putative quinol monooxygenase [Syntrophales bacterium]
MIVVTAFIKAKEGNGDDLERVIKGYAPKFLEDEGCLEYRVHRRLDDPHLFFFYEKYASDTALKNHSTSPHFKEMGAAMRAYVDGRPEINMYREV